MLRRISWATLRQIQAIRESVDFTLQKRALVLDSGGSDDELVEWLRDQGVEPFYYRVMPEGTLQVSLVESVNQAVKGYGVDVLRVQMAGAYSRFDEPDVGWDRSSTGWDRLSNFITSSALIRLLGAMEQYELDVLKALLHYRPAGAQHIEPLEFVDADLAIAIEMADSDGRYKKPALWSWIKKPAENAVERRRIFKAVFGLDCYPSSFGAMKPSEIKAYYQAIYKQRNALAHGRTPVTFSLGDYCKAEAFVLALVLSLSSACKERYQVGV